MMPPSGQSFGTTPAPRPVVEEPAVLEAALVALAPEVVAFIQHHCGDPHLGADLAQDALGRAMQSLGGLRRPEALRGWVFRIAVNCFNDHLRRRRLEPIAAGPLPETVAPAERGPERDLLARELDAVLRQELLRLPERQRTVLMLHGVRDLSHAEIAGLLGITVDAVKVSLFHAREKMRVRLAAYLDHVPEKRHQAGRSGGGAP